MDAYARIIQRNLTEFQSQPKRVLTASEKQEKLIKEYREMVRERDSGSFGPFVPPIKSRNLITMIRHTNQVVADRGAPSEVTLVFRGIFKDFPATPEALNNIALRNVLRTALSQGFVYLLNFFTKGGIKHAVVLTERTIDNLLSKLYPSNEGYDSFAEATDLENRIDTENVITLALVPLSRHRGGALHTHKASYNPDTLNDMDRQVVTALAYIQVLHNDAKAHLSKPCAINAITLACQFNNVPIDYKIVEYTVSQHLTSGYLETSKVIKVAKALNLHIVYKSEPRKGESMKANPKGSHTIYLCLIKDHWIPHFSITPELAAYMGVPKVTDSYQLMKSIDLCKFVVPTNRREANERGLIPSKFDDEFIKPWLLTLNHRGLVDDLRKKFKPEVMIIKLEHHESVKATNTSRLAKGEDPIQPLSLEQITESMVNAQLQRLQNIDKPELVEVAGLKPIRIVGKDQIPEYLEELKAEIKRRKAENPAPVGVSYGIIDFETYKAAESRVTPYSVSLLTGYGSNEFCQTFFSGPSMDCLQTCLSTWFKREYSLKQAFVKNPDNKGLKCPHDPHNLYLAAHNLGFDLSCIRSNDRCLELTDLIGTVSHPKSCKVKWEVGDKQHIQLHLRDTYCLIQTALEDVGRVFGVNVAKAPYPYSYFNRENVEALAASDWTGRARVFDMLEHVKESGKSDFIKACLALPSYKYKAPKYADEPEGSTILVAEYVDYYNQLDVRVTREAVNTFHQIMYSFSGVDTTGCLTISAVASLIPEVLGCTQGIVSLYGPLSEYIRTRMIGGMCQMRDNKPQIISPKDLGTGKRVLLSGEEVDTVLTWIEDFDINSLYPYAQSQGLPAGLPSLIPDRSLTADNIKTYLEKGCLLATFRITNVPKTKGMSFIPFKEEGVLTYVHAMPKDESGNNLPYFDVFGSTDRYQLLTELGLVHDRDFEVLSGIHYPVLDYKMAAYTLLLHYLRNDAKADKNDGLSNCTKMVANSWWGKRGQRCYNTKMEMTRSLDEAVDMVVKDPFKCLGVESVDGVHYVTKLKSLVPMYKNEAHVAVKVLDQSKIVVYHHYVCMEAAGMITRYGDTDSLHESGVTEEKIQEYRRLYKELFGNDPMEMEKVVRDGKVAYDDILGNMKSDYKLPGDIASIVKGTEYTTRCTEAVYAQPKVYCNRLTVENPAGTYHTYHNRAKGVTKESVNELVTQTVKLQGEGTDPIETRLNLFRKIAEGEAVDFDQLAGDKVKFVYDRLGARYEEKVIKTIANDDKVRLVAPNSDIVRELRMDVGEVYTHNRKKYTIDPDKVPIPKPQIKKKCMSPAELAAILTEVNSQFQELIKPESAPELEPTPEPKPFIGTWLSATDLLNITASIPQKVY